jgi:hypothetical protein
MLMDFEPDSIPIQTRFISSLIYNLNAPVLLTPQQLTCNTLSRMTIESRERDQLSYRIMMQVLLIPGNKPHPPVSVNER